MKLTSEVLQDYVELDNKAQEKGFYNYQDKREFETGNKEELEEVREIQKQINEYKKDHIFSNFKNQFETYDKEKVWNDEEIKLLFDDLMKNYGYIHEDNFDIEYCINNKDKVNY